MYLYNSPEYCETNFAAIKIRGMPINVNYRYLDDELALPARQRRRRGARVPHARSATGWPASATGCRRLRLLVEVDDGPAADGPTHVDGAVGYERDPGRRRAGRRASRRRATRSTCFYTGGTTGMPKGVMYPMREFTAFFLRVLPADDRPAADGRRRAAGRQPRGCPTPGRRVVAMSGPPLMHGTGCWLGMMAPHLLGGTAVLLEGAGSTPVELWDTVEREGVQHLDRRRRRVRQAAAARARRRSPAAGTRRACG